MEPSLEAQTFLGKDFRRGCVLYLSFLVFVVCLMIQTVLVLQFSHFVFVIVQQKYFDSGDYNMAKAKMKNKQLPSAPTEKTEITGGHIPTPQDLPQRKTSIVASKLAG